MRVAYRRGAGSLPLTKFETGERGVWLDKRSAFRTALLAGGHVIEYVSRLSRVTQRRGYERSPWEPESFDVLLIEFAGLNMKWLGEDWQETAEMVNEFGGPVVFLCDDPDLPMPYKLFDCDWSRVTVAVNAIDLVAARHVLRVPPEAKVVDAPFASLVEPMTFAGGDGGAVYYGRRQGRAAQAKALLEGVAIAGRPNDWPGREVVAPPSAATRREWYRQWSACLALFDERHALTGWRTGRAYHALLAGVPVLSPLGNVALDAWAVRAGDPADVMQFVMSATGERESTWARQVQLALTPFDFKALGL